MTHNGIAGLRTPRPTYPVEGYAQHSAGEGVCHVVFNSGGQVATATMVKSTGSKLLDDNTCAWARDHWTGQRNSGVNVPVDDALLTKPPYPEIAKEHRITGAGVYVVKFGAAGRVENVRILRSTGSTILDQNTLDFAAKHWYGPPDQVIKVPIVYRLRR